MFKDQVDLLPLAAGVTLLGFHKDVTRCDMPMPVEVDHGVWCLPSSDAPKGDVTKGVSLELPGWGRKMSLLRKYGVSIRKSVCQSSSSC